MTTLEKRLCRALYATCALLAGAFVAAVMWYPLAWLLSENVALFACGVYFAQSARWVYVTMSQALVEPDKTIKVRLR